MQESIRRDKTKLKRQQSKKKTRCIRKDDSLDNKEYHWGTPAPAYDVEIWKEHHSHPNSMKNLDTIQNHIFFKELMSQSNEIPWILCKNGCLHGETEHQWWLNTRKVSKKNSAVVKFFNYFWKNWDWATIVWLAPLEATDIRRVCTCSQTAAQTSTR